MVVLPMVSLLCAEQSLCLYQTFLSLLAVEGGWGDLPPALPCTSIHMKTWSVPLKSGSPRSFPSGQNWNRVVRTFQGPSSGRWGMQPVSKKPSSWLATALCFCGVCTLAGEAGELHSGYFVVNVSCQAVVMSLCIHGKKRLRIKLFQCRHGKVRPYFNVREELNLFMWNCYLQRKVLMMMRALSDQRAISKCGRMGQCLGQQLNTLKRTKKLINSKQYFFQKQCNQSPLQDNLLWDNN